MQPAKKRGTAYTRADDELRPIIKEIFDQSKGRFGAQKIKYKLHREGRQIGRKHIRRLMQEMGLVCKQEQLRHFCTTNRKYKVYRNRIQQNFLADAPNLK